MKKKLLLSAILLAFASLLPLKSQAYDFSAVAPSGQTLYYNIDNSTNTAVVTYNSTSSSSTRPSGDVIIPESVSYAGETYLVTAIGDEAFGKSASIYSGGISYYAAQITSVSIPNTVTQIGNYAFNSCPLAGELTIPNSVISIGNQAFQGCYLTSVSIGNSVTSIGQYAFYDCTNLTSVILPYTVATIGSGAFYGVTNVYYAGSANGSPWGAVAHWRYYCTEDDLYYADAEKTILCGCSENLTSLNIPNRVVEITASAFSGNTRITAISFSNAMTHIGDYAFYGCSALTGVELPESLTTIGQQSFASCTGLTSLTIPEAVSQIGTGAFDGCPLQTLNYNADSCYFDGTVFGTQLTTVIFGSNVRYIPAYAFQNCGGLTYVNLPNSLRGIGEYAFSNTGLTSVTIPNSVTTMGASAFASCNSLTSLTIGSSLTVIPYNAFSSSGLVSLIVPDNVTTVAGSSFKGCTSLTSAIFGDGVATIEDNAFRNCSRLMSIQLGEGVENIEEDAFRDCGIIGELVFPQNVLNIEHGAFAGCYGISEITCLGRVAPFISNEDGEYYYTSDGWSYSYSKATFSGIDSTIVVNVPCGSQNLYAGRWSYFHNFSESAFLFHAVSEDLLKGTVTVTEAPTCASPVATIVATPRNGYRFDHWSDGSTDNPYLYTVTGSMTLTAYFSPAGGNNGIDDVESTDNLKIYTRGNKIVIETTDAFKHSSNQAIIVYDVMGRIIHTNPSTQSPTNTIEIPVPTTGLYMVKVADQPSRKVLVRP